LLGGLGSSRAVEVISGSDYRMKGTILTYAAVTLIVGIALLGVLSLRF
jgi:hypothetical protein